MLFWGAKVFAYESSEIIGVLLEDARRRSLEIPKLREAISERLILQFRDITKVKTDFADVIYLDPMYLNHNRKTLPNKEMRIFLKISNLNPINQLFPYFKDKNFKKIIVKRPLKDKIFEHKSNLSFKGKSIRYDVFI